MKKHRLFPTLITESVYPRFAEFKPAFFNVLPQHSNDNLQSNENTGHNDLQHGVAFADLYAFIGRAVKDHIKECGLDPEFQNLYIVKSWLMITKDWSVPVHNHADAQLSFVYYVNIPTSFTPDRICFISPRPNQFYKNIYSQNATEWNEFNAHNFSILPTEGMLLVFPASVDHFTGSGEENEYTLRENSIPSKIGPENMRICLAGDIVFTYKTVEAKSYGLMPISNWKLI